MDREAIVSRIDQANFRIGRIEPAMGRLGKTVAHIQYRCPTPPLRNALVNVHNRKLGEENRAHEAEKRKDPFSKNGYKPRTFDDTLNEAAARIKGVSIPYLDALEKELPQEIKSLEYQLPVREQMARLRKAKGVLERQISDHMGIKRPLISQFEHGIKPANERLVEAYGFVLGLSPAEIAKLQEIRRAEQDERKKQAVRKMIKKHNPGREVSQIGAILRRLRDEAGISIVELARDTQLSHEDIAKIEHGRVSVLNESTIIKLTRARLIKIPESAFPSWLHNPQNRGEYLRSLRIKAGISRVDFAAKSGRTEESIGRTENNEWNHSSKTIKLYEDILGVNIVFPDFSATGRETA